MAFVAKIGDVVLDRGVIMGPGHINVMINGVPLAAAFDEVAPHGCCGSPGCEIHCVAFLEFGKIFPNITVSCSNSTGRFTCWLNCRCNYLIAGVSVI